MYTLIQKLMYISWNTCVYTSMLFQLAYLLKSFPTYITHISFSCLIPRGVLFLFWPINFCRCYGRDGKGTEFFCDLSILQERHKILAVKDHVLMSLHVWRLCTFLTFCENQKIESNKKQTMTYFTISRKKIWEGKIFDFIHFLNHHMIKISVIFNVFHIRFTKH